MPSVIFTGCESMNSNKLDSKLVKNSLGYDSNLFVYQDKTMFNYSVDTILLGNFATVNSSTRHVLEIGTNNGALSIFLSERYSKMKIDALEIQKRAYELAIKNIELNNKGKVITPILGDFNDFYEAKLKENHKYNLIICNPPFYKVDASRKRKGSEEVYIATHEVKLNLEQIVKGSSKIIKQKGQLAMVIPTERFVDLCEYMRKYKFEVKRIQFIYPRINTKSNLVLVEGRFMVGWGSHFLPNIYLHPEEKENHIYNDEVVKLYKPIKFDEGENYE